MTDPRATVLLDLDDTLLQNDMGRFLPAYFREIESWLAETIPGDDIMTAFLEASQLMLVNDRPDRTLADVFYSHFLPRIDLSYEDLQPALDRFYREFYPRLQSLTAPMSGAEETVRFLAQGGHALVIATNPLLPAAAIHQRVDWAGLALKSIDFDLVTSFERFHFAKPGPAYYAEILAYLGWPEDPVVMVGNEVVNDIRGASEFGLATYHVTPPGVPAPGDARHGSGPLSGFPAWFAGRSPEDLAPDYHSPGAALAVLKSTAAALQSLVRETDPLAWRRRPDEEWSPLETLVHLKDVETEVNLKRAESFLAAEAPFITGVDTDRWYADGFGDLPAVEEVLDGFMQSRMRTLEILSGIPAEAWGAPARHSIFGPTDLLEIAVIMGGHDQTHVRHIKACLDSGTSGG